MTEGNSNKEGYLHTSRVNFDSAFRDNSLTYKRSIDLPQELRVVSGTRALIVSEPRTRLVRGW